MLDIAMTPIVSSLLLAMGYDHESQTLRLQFKPGKKEIAAELPGKTFDYSPVPVEVFGEMAECDSVGKYFLSHIKPHWKGVDINAPKIEAPADEAAA